MPDRSAMATSLLVGLLLANADLTFDEGMAALAGADDPLIVEWYEEQDGSKAGARQLQRHWDFAVKSAEELRDEPKQRTRPNGRAPKGIKSGPEFELTLDKLRNKAFPPIKWIVPLYLPEGLTVFAGKPKIGKSWLMLGVALGVARGTKALGQKVEKGDVLYCGLEDGERRMQDRCTKILGADLKTWPKNFTFRWGLDALDDGGLDFLEKWLTDHPNRRLVVIDTLGKVKGNKARDEEQYLFDYRMVGSLQELSTKYRAAIVVVHHVRKAAAEDVLDTVSGSTGIAGAADSVMVLGRERGGVQAERPRPRHRGAGQAG